MTSAPKISAGGLSGKRIVVLGLDATGYASADGLLAAGAQVTVLDERDDDRFRAKAQILETLGATVWLGDSQVTELPAGTSAIVATTEAAAQPFLDQAVERELPIWSDLEVAWRVAQQFGESPTWFLIAGVGASTTAQLLANILRTAGLVVDVVGKARPVMETILDEITYDALVVAPTDIQLRWVDQMSPFSAAIVGLSPDSRAEDLADSAQVYHQVRCACVYDVDAPLSEDLVAAADVVEGARAIGITRGIPAPSMIGVVDGLLVDRAFIAQRNNSAAEVAKLDEVRPEQLAEALTAIALARSFNIRPLAIAEGIRTAKLS